MDVPRALPSSDTQLTLTGESSTVSAVMATRHISGETTLEAVPDAKNSGKVVSLESDLWRQRTARFLEGEPKVLGVVQIMIALITLILGAVMQRATTHMYLCDTESTISVCSCYSFWGSLMFMISGSLSLSAGIKTTNCLIQSSLVMNIISSVLAAGGIFINFFSLFIQSAAYHQRHPQNKSLARFIFMSMDGILLLFSMLEFCISVSNSAFGCKVACCSSSEVVLVMPPESKKAGTASPALLEQGVMPPTGLYNNVPENYY
ncbi:PREDICTED: membrane-spanning 4-domains subfamily A member 4A-like isoform X1 [Dipodomys ordii]|uniref:Membrane-spanning 4-domains subfamily A member 4A-like isoform X1 n=1 Tax=Dipodomys ordii TaxID=10020 RepID=A0A1S3G937_DIPOR|nr:PREDICTED: membrane-spanning 4-domains subfamily A member 4A-like isoform X1 [Dipodomys ordii]